MNMSSQIAVTAVAMVIGSAGLLYPLHQSITELEVEVESLEESAAIDDVQSQIVAMHARIAEAEVELEGRTLVLCPDSSEARLEFETALTLKLVASGLQRVSVDRTKGTPIHGVPTFVIELVVEGDAVELHTFLQGLESLLWANRVIHLEVQPGLGRRTVEMKVAVPLESMP
ncbi:MAG: hypothetical protein ACI9EF_001128 [Pseudohongiellaceae bacterium]|jgi:hypothetical protein